MEKYFDPVHGEVELTLVEKYEKELQGAIRKERLYKMPSGDYIVFSELIMSGLPNSDFKQEFYIKKEWADTIVKQNKLTE